MTCQIIDLGAGIFDRMLHGAIGGLAAEEISILLQFMLSFRINVLPVFWPVILLVGDVPHIAEVFEAQSDNALHDVLFRCALLPLLETMGSFGGFGSLRLLQSQCLVLCLLRGIKVARRILIDISVSLLSVDTLSQSIGRLVK